MEKIDISLIITISAIIGMISAYLGHKKGRNPYLWFFVGFIFGLLGLLFLLLFSKKPVKKEEEEAPIKRPIKEITPKEPEKLWYYLDKEHKQHGPVGKNFIKSELENRRLNEKSYVWNEDFTEWKKIKDLKETFDLLK